MQNSNATANATANATHASFAYDEDYAHTLNVIITNMQHEFIAEYNITSVAQYKALARNFNITQHYFSSTVSDCSTVEALAEQIAQLL